MTTTRPPPHVLFVYEGSSDGHLTYLRDCGLRVSEAPAAEALAQAIDLQPDIVVLDFSADGDVTAQLKTNTATQHIPILALAQLSVEKR